MCDAYFSSRDPAIFQKWLIPLLMFSAFLRFSDLVALQWHQIEFDSDCMWLFIPRSKTDQRGAGAWVPVATSDAHHCPVARVKEFLFLAGFSQVSIGSLICVFRPGSGALPSDAPPSYSTVQNWCREAFARVGLDPSTLGTHSFRKTAATLAVDVGVPDRLFKALGRWRSDGAKEMYVTQLDSELIRASRLLQDPTRQSPTTRDVARI
ncbi:unnamed protein product [Closterium sp. NIES-53]